MLGEPRRENLISTEHNCVTQPQCPRGPHGRALGSSSHLKSTLWFLLPTFLLTPPSTVSWKLNLDACARTHKALLLGYTGVAMPCSLESQALAPSLSLCSHQDRCISLPAAITEYTPWWLKQHVFLLSQFRRLEVKVLVSLVSSEASLACGRPCSHCVSSTHHTYQIITASKDRALLAWLPGMIYVLRLTL